jgi:VCBS repeat-containing protein
VAVGESQLEQFTVQVSDEHGATAVQGVVVTVMGANDAPVVDAGGDTGAAEEDVQQSVSGQLTATDVDNGATLTWSVVGSATGAYGLISIDAGGEWTYSLNAAAQSLAAWESHDESFKILVTDEHGAIADRDVVITVTGTNDAPSIDVGGDAGSVEEDATLTAGGQLAATDVDNDAVLTWSLGGSAAGSYGSLAVDVSGGWTYTLDNDAAQSLSVGETHDEQFTVQVADEHGVTSDRVVTITITGSNDVPELGAGDVTGGVEEDVLLAASGQLTATDVDNGAMLGWSVVGSADGTYGSIAVDENGQWTYTLDEAASQSLAEGETHDEPFTIQVADEHGATSDQVVTITVTGTNDAPEIGVGGDAGGVKEDDQLTTSGQLTATDVDNGATLGWSVVGSATGTYGSLAVDATTGAWTYTLDNDSTAVQSLEELESHDDLFTVSVTDENGATEEKAVTITVTGTNDAPVIGDSVVAGTVEEDVTSTVSGQMSAIDMNVLNWEVVGSVDGAYGSVVVDETGLWTYTLDNDSDAVQALAAGESHVERFTMQVTDEYGATASQEVTVVVAGTNDAPILETDLILVEPDTTTLLDVLANDTDAEGEALTIVGVESDRAEITPDDGWEIRTEEGLVQVSPTQDGVQVRRGDVEWTV